MSTIVSAAAGSRLAPAARSTSPRARAFLDEGRRDADLGFLFRDVITLTRRLPRPARRFCSRRPCRRHRLAGPLHMPPCTSAPSRPTTTTWSRPPRVPSTLPRPRQSGDIAGSAAGRRDHRLHRPKRRRRAWRSTRRARASWPRPLHSTWLSRARRRRRQFRETIPRPVATDVAPAASTSSASRTSITTLPRYDKPSATASGALRAGATAPAITFVAGRPDRGRCSTRRSTCLRRAQRPTLDSEHLFPTWHPGRHQGPHRRPRARREDDGSRASRRLSGSAWPRRLGRGVVGKSTTHLAAATATPSTRGASRSGPQATSGPPVTTSRERLLSPPSSWGGSPSTRFWATSRWLWRPCCCGLGEDRPPAPRLRT